MSVAKVGKERIIDLIDTDITGAQLGTDGTAPTEADTDLITPVAVTSTTTTNTQGTKILNVKHVLLSTIGTGNSYQEFGVYVNSILLSRVVFPLYSHTVNSELHTTTQYRVK